jgi:ATP-dependent DNA helicase RecG
MVFRAVDIAQLRLLPDDQVAQLLAARAEDQWFDRTSARTTARHLGDLMVGFANAEGGLIVIGIHQGRIEGIAEAGKRVNEWRQAALDFTEPPVRHRFELIECVNREGQPDQLAVIEVESSERVHTTASGKTYLRVGDENRRLGPLEAQELRYDKGESTFDAHIVEADLASLDPRLVERYLQRVRAQAGAKAVLPARGLAVERGGVLRPTVAGLLAFGGSPQTFFPEASLRLLRYRGTSRETGARANVVADRRLEGPVTAQIDAARRLLRRWLPEAIRLQHEGRFAQTTQIPEFVWLEAIVNAVTHRSYRLAGDHVRVELFDDRLEVESPGRLPGLVRVDNIRSTRFARNPRLARALHDLGYGRELGEGVNRMFEEMSRVGLPDPVYTQGPASVRVVLLADPLSRRILDQLPPGSERFVEYLSRTGRVTTMQAVELLAASRPTVLRHLHALAEAGMIEHVGTSPKDPRGFWRLARGSRP